MKPFKGLVFSHKRVMDPDNQMQPMRYVVTKVADGMVYYKPLGATKSKEYTEIENFDKVVLDRNI